MLPAHKLSVRIGGGTKIHPVYADKNEKGQYYGFLFACMCPNTGNGRAAHAIEIVSETWKERNCKG